MNKTQDFTKGVIWKTITFFFFPILIGSFFQQLYNTVDTIIVGQACGTKCSCCCWFNREFDKLSC